MLIPGFLGQYVSASTSNRPPPPFPLGKLKKFQQTHTLIHLSLLPTFFVLPPTYFFPPIFSILPTFWGQYMIQYMCTRLTAITEQRRVPGGGGTQQSFIRGGSAPRSKPLPFYIPFLIGKIPFRIPSIENCTPFLYLRSDFY